MAWAMGWRESPGQIAALTQCDAVLEARATFRCTLKTEKGQREE